MKKLKNRLAAFVLACCMVFATAASTLAVEKNLPDSFCIDDENGISVTDAGAYFLYSDNLMPGDVITRTLTLRNLNQGNPFELCMIGESPESAGPVDWLENLHLRITLDGRELYAGRLRGDGRDTRTMEGNGADLLYQGLELGTYQQGDYGVLKFVVTADAGHLSAEDLREASKASIKWVFYAAKNAEEDGPKTGELVRFGLYILLALLIILCAAILWKGRYAWKGGISCG